MIYGSGGGGGDSRHARAWVILNGEQSGRDVVNESAWCGGRSGRGHALGSESDGGVICVLCPAFIVAGVLCACVT